jgi:hypothetical protein
MPRKPNPRTLTAIFLLASAALSVAILAVRNLYDDEIASLPLIAGSVRDILQLNTQGDIHPPGMYLLGHFAYTLIPSYRWMNLVPGVVLYLGLAVFLFQLAPLFARTRAQLCLLLLATLHPQLLMWGVTFRWYSWWTGLALITIAVALQPRSARPSLGPARAVVLGMLLAGLFYLNYITFLFALALAIAMLLRHPAQHWTRLLAAALLTLVTFAALIAPHLHTMLTVHLAQQRTQRHGLAASFLRLLQSLAASEAFLPWHPAALLACAVFALLCLWGLFALLRTDSQQEAISADADAASPPLALASIALFGVLFFLLVAASGLGGKPRSGLLLIPVMATAAAWIVSTRRPRTQSAILIFYALFCALGASHLLCRHGLAKATMNDRPEQVVAFVRQPAGNDCGVVVTYDTGLAFALAQAHLPRVMVLSPYSGTILGGSETLPADCARTTLYAVHSYLGGDTRWDQALAAELQSTLASIQGQPHARYFSSDPDAVRKRSLAHLPILGAELAGAAQLPDYRFVVLFGPMDRSAVPALRQRLPDFTSSSGNAGAPSD